MSERQRGECALLARVGRAVLGLVLLFMSTAAVAPEEFDPKTRRPYFPEITHPTLQRFHMDDRPTRIIMGPFGSGKSVGCVMEIIRRACQQPPFHGVRYTRWAVVRNTCPELKSTTIKTWKEWTDSRVIMDVPYHTAVKINLPDGTRVDSEVYFLALDRPDDVKKLMSLDVTGMWLNEARYIPEAVYDVCIGRKGRYPGTMLGGCGWNGVWIDTNPPAQGHWIHRIVETERNDERVGFFRQPGGLLKTVSPGGKVTYLPNPDAENVENLPGKYKYYTDMLGRDEDYIKVHVLGEWGTVFTGKPVYDRWFIDSMHVSPELLQPYRGIPLLFGVDFGLTPALVMAQLTPRGQVRVLREFCCRDGGLEQFLEREVMPVINMEYTGMERRSWHDPAGEQRSQANEVTCGSVLNRFGFHSEPAPTNDFSIRRDAVIKGLSRNIDGQPGVLIDPRCENLIKGFRGAYQYNRIPSSDGVEKWRDVPDKTAFESHVSDGMQYLCLGVFGMQAETPLVLPPQQTYVNLGRVM